MLNTQQEQQFKNRLFGIISNMSIDEKFEIFNCMIEAHNRLDDEIFTMDMFDELFHGRSPLEIVYSLNAGFNPNDGYFYFDGYANATSCNLYEALDNLTSDDELVDYIWDIIVDNKNIPIDNVELLEIQEDYLTVSE